ncbi:MAG: SH3 domain-containing protein [Anaerolineales bacterium]|nr:SH3 domain-containing protein [Anaerolineales bacterium]
MAARTTRQVSASIFLAFLLSGSWKGQMTALAQAITSTPTMMATVAATATFVPTPTVNGPSVFVPDRVNVRSGPGTYYEKVGVLVAGQFAQAVGRTALGEWIVIEYPEGTGEQAWVYSPLVVVRESTVEDLPEVEPPPTPTLPAVPVAGFTLSPQHTQPATRLPTFTPAPPVPQPTFATPEIEGGTMPPIVLIAGLFSLGILSGIVAIFRQRG